MNAVPGDTDVRRSKRTLVLLVILFAAPFPLAWVLFNYTGLGQGSGTGAYGHLITPPRPLPEVVLHDPANDTNAVLRRKWSLLYVHRGECDGICVAALYRMRQLRLAMGKNGTRVQRVLVFVAAPASLPPALLEEYAGQLVATDAGFGGDQPLAVFRQGPADDPASAGRLYLVDPLGNLMMSYPADARPEGIIADMERLLKYSSAG